MPQAISDLISNDDDQSPQLSFAGCGFLCIYHAGVGAAIKEYAPQLARNRILGSSAGAIAAAGLICDVCISSATSTILQMVTEARAGSLQALSPNFNVMGLVRKGLEQSLPPNAHIICSGRLFISATRARDYKNVIISEFDSREELIQAIICSCFIPVYCGLRPPSYRGEQYIDGGFSDNQPGKFEPGTITVSPFSGESDICPNDADSASLFGFDFCGTPIQFTTQNLFRMVVTLFPPSPEVCARICRQGFEDTLRFLTKNYMAPCVKCLTIQSDAIPLSKQKEMGPTTTNWTWPPARQQNGHGQMRREVKLARSATVACALNLRGECERCCQPLDHHFESPKFSGVPMPSMVQKSFAEMEARNSTWLNYLRRWRIFRWWYRLLIPVILPFELMQFSMHKFSSLLHWALSGDLLSMPRVHQMADFLLAEIENRRLLHSPSNALSIGPISAFKIASSDVPPASLPSVSAASHQSLSSIASGDLAPIGRKVSSSVRSPSVADLAQQRKISVAPLDLAMPRTVEEEEAADEAEAQAEPTTTVLSDYCSRHDAILAFHYLDDETNQLKMCQIFDAQGRHPRQTEDGEECPQAAALSSTFFADEEEQKQLEEEEEKEEPAKGGEDSGLSLAEEENGGAEEPTQKRKLSSVSFRRDACCSPVSFRHLSSTNLSASSASALNPLGVSRRHTFSTQRPGGPAAKSRIPALVGRKLSAGGQAPRGLRMVAGSEPVLPEGNSTDAKVGNNIQQPRKKQFAARPVAMIHPRRQSTTSEESGDEEGEVKSTATNRSSNSNTTSRGGQQQQRRMMAR